MSQATLLGFQFAPRIPDLKSRRLYSFGKASAYPSLEPLIAGRIKKDQVSGQWVESKKGTPFATFREDNQDNSFIYISDINGRVGSNGRDFLIRLPKCGGPVAWTWSNPLVWGDFNIVHRDH
jgi:hypothetical protein